MATTSWNGQRLPTIGIERVAVELLRLTAKARMLTPKSRIAENYKALETACEIVHAMGYGRTQAHVKGVVAECFNADHDDFEALAEQLTEIHWR